MYLQWLKKYNLLIFNELDSTNSEAMRLARAYSSGNFVIWAKSQTAGRGRYGRSWQSPAGNLYVSLLLGSDISMDRMPQLSFVAALAVHDTISKFMASDSNLKLSLKWPNDVYIDDAKLAGILLESVKVKDKSYIVIGLGINIENKPQNLNKKITCLHEHDIKVKNSSQLLHIFMTFFEKRYKSWQEKGFHNIRKDWLKRAYKLNQVITIDDGKSPITGIFKDIDFSGAIRVKLTSGHIYALSAGEVFFGEEYVS